MGKKEYSPWRATWLKLVGHTKIKFYGPGKIVIVAKPKGKAMREFEDEE